MDRMLRVDLSAGSVTSEEIPARWLEKYVGGKGVGARYLYEELEPGTDAHAPENVLLFMLGPLTGYTPGEQRYAAITKSPLTGAFLDSYSGGTFPERLAGSLDGHMGVLVTGEADDPVVLSVDDGEATLESADDLWGLDAEATCERFPDAAVACVGPAGENGVQYATIASDGGDHHAGRGGAGTVMGSKNLKAIVAHGTAPEGLSDLRERYGEAFAESEAGRWLAASDTLETVDFANEVGVLPTRGWQESSFEGVDEIGIERVREAATGRERPDDHVPGGFRVDSDEGESVPRGATPIVLGAGLGIDDFDAVAMLGAICDRLAMDVITAGNAVAWAVRASQEGLIDRDLSFGDETAARELIEEIADRSTPLGDALADGVDRAAEQYGGEDLIPTVKGMELSSYDPRNAETMALAYATSDRGGCHRRARPVELEPVTSMDRSREARVTAVVEEQNRRALLWSLIADDFLEEVLEAGHAAEWLSAVGYDHDPESLSRVGERIWTLVRLFNVREGFSRIDDELPPPLTDPLEDATDSSDGTGGDGIEQEAFDALLEAYYAARDWDRRGRPTADLLQRLDLTTVPDESTPVPSTADDDRTTDTRR
ncbi:aldehyde ferredoxin oxidoreductase C-terminal domain-containing protein [Natronolimnohabitans sp. A-GB9]|uniref:aldehyde ferredoxin oxidoreductase family protein n=1 Tax=Natronolimnohabitans sp. A-GB9 TaxID=3069757 RepID=UPI0027B5F3FE|nr:aldehyde ferredoxin oxidoreductase C-terminal domain-containing protein [Natronolimnohabitans sp. A-GB9]MDQ2050642.1 aldehyde ferredoxin oxidoreductase C-terminal domain-containing protein [Natronolimnohabitans sp. A-GB9]